MDISFSLNNTPSTNQNTPPINLSEMSPFEIDHQFPYYQSTEFNKEKFKSISQDDLEKALSQNKLNMRLIPYFSDEHIRNLKLSSLPREAVQFLCNISCSTYETLEKKQQRFALLAPAEIKKALQEEKLDLKSYFTLLLPEAFLTVSLLNLNEAEMRAFDESLGTTYDDRAKRLDLLLHSDLFLQALIQGNIPPSICTLLPVEFFKRIPLSLLSKTQIEALFPPEKMLTYHQNAFAMIPPEEVQKAIEKDLLNEKYRSLISPTQLFSIKLSHLSQMQIESLFPSYDNSVVLEERWSYLDPTEICNALEENRIPDRCLSLFTEKTYATIKISALSTRQIRKLFPDNLDFSQERFSRLELSEIEACIQKNTLPNHCYKWIPNEKLPLLNLSLFLSEINDSNHLLSDVNYRNYVLSNIKNRIDLLIDSKPSRLALLNPIDIKSLIHKKLFPTHYYNLLSIEQVPYDQIPLMSIGEFLEYFPLHTFSPHLEERFKAIPPPLLEVAIKLGLLQAFHFKALSDNQLRHLDISRLTKEQLFYIFPLEGNLLTNLKEKQRRFQLIPHNYVMQFVEKDLEQRFSFIDRPLKESPELQLFLALCSQRARDLIRTHLQCRALSRNRLQHAYESSLDQSSD